MNLKALLSKFTPRHGDPRHDATRYDDPAIDLAKRLGYDSSYDLAKRLGFADTAELRRTYRAYQHKRRR
ncbi:MAG: hypothetical protein U0670_03495 [Anaerolineae bacterium]